ncbi:MAG: hypothetical protein M3Y33_15740, partial [Actinomycetota bacterium]|nr:hypothetical protein [Actinomycetota bacterium]
MLAALSCGYFCVLLRTCRNEQVIGEAVITMHACRNTRQAAQRDLLRNIAEVLQKQDAVADRITAEVAVRAWPG